ncbi:MAG: TatD DNase family protein, partial [Gammaproteobacteria bacterium]
MMLSDSHCHLDDDRFDPDRDAIVSRASTAGVRRIIVPATTANRWEKVKNICEQYENAFPAYGLHPMFIEQHCEAHITELDEWLDREKPIAVGECGIDFFHTNKDGKWQLQLFEEQLQLAVNHQLPVIIHVRKGLDVLISKLRKTPTVGGVIHSFSGSLQQAGQLLDLGYKLGIAATIGFERAQKLQKVVKSIDITGLLIESDAPDQPGPDHRGALNEPAFIVEQLNTIAELRSMRSED